MGLVSICWQDESYITYLKEDRRFMPSTLENEWLGINQLHAFLGPTIVLVCPSGFTSLKAAAPLAQLK